MRSSYDREDVFFLLKDITGLVEPDPAEVRERQIQSGRHYCEMLPLEYVPGKEYTEAYEEALKHFAVPVAEAVGRLADRIMETGGTETVLVSLARAGTPAGILLKRYIRKKYEVSLPHYSISIIRGLGIDRNAMKYLLERYAANRLQFVDGWTGKGAILRELEKEMAEYEGVSPGLAVLADPAGMAALYGTREDLLIPSSCLNSTVSGLVSRTFFRKDIIGENDFHGAVYYGELEKEDRSMDFIRAIEKEFPEEASKEPPHGGGCGMEEVERLAGQYGIGDINLIKPGIGEATRVLLRRIPWKILIREGCQGDASLTHMLRLAQEKNVPVEYVSLRYYKACGLIKKLADT